ncbi:mitochondrial tRNA methylthiotransferase CDK5RAP1-like [Clavelina lepadiformis]|uniref:mitochondrial tRNA methylthiotransferase CDK5RAP1-like n=1 Tax=Clavelina lepadiformis TaxID=159417 RepID=UPI004042C5AA
MHLRCFVCQFVTRPLRHSKAGLLRNLHYERHARNFSCFSQRTCNVTVCPNTIKSQCKSMFVAKTNYSTNIKGKGRDISHVPDIKEFLSASNDATNKQLHDSTVEPIPYLEKATYSKPPNGKTVYFETYGCQMNVNDAEYAWAILKDDGYKRVDNLEKADVILLVTCSIREKAEDRIWKRLTVLKEKKLSGYPKIGILGCMAERLKKEIVEKEKAVDIVAGPDAYRDLPRLLEHATNESQTAINVMLSVDETYADIMPVRFDEKTKTAFVSIMRGCDNMCSYCIVPFTRGRERSRPVKSIVDEIRKLSDMGIKQVNLLGQNVNSYRDMSSVEVGMPNLNAEPMSQGFKTIYKPKLGGLRFADLLDRVSSVDPEMRIRFISPHPKDFPDEVLEIISERTNICKQIHLPAQSGSSRILERMRRGHTREDYLNLVERIRSYIPDVSLSTDMITGFCGETEEDHEDSISLMRLVKYNYAFLFKYSMRKKTHAYHKMNDDVPEKVKVQRLQEIMKVYYELLEQTQRSLVGEVQLALVEKISPKSTDYLLSRNDGNIKVVIPNTEIPSSRNNAQKSSIEPGDYIAVELTSYKPNTFTGMPLFHSSIKEFHSENHVLQQSNKL